MAQSGYTPIQLYYSTTASNVPLAANMANGELAINIADGKIYYKNSSGVVTLFGSSGDVSTISFGTTGLTPSTATGGAVTVAGTLNVANGGTGLTSLTAGYIPFGNGTSAFNSTSNLFWDSANARLGINTNTPSRSLDVNTSISTAYSSTAANTSIASIVNSYGSAANNAALQTYYTAYWTSLWNVGLVETGSSFAGAFVWQNRTGSSTYAERMRIDSSGNVGIGTTSPAAKLDIAGSARVNNSGGSTILSIGDTAASTYSNIRMFGGSGKYNYQISVQNNVNNSFEITPSTAAGGVTFSTPALVIDSSGNVGIGVTSPARTFAIGGTAGTVNLAIQDANTGYTTTDGYQLQLSSVGDIYHWNYENAFMVFGTNNTERMRITSTGNVGIGTSSPTTFGYNKTLTVADSTSASIGIVAGSDSFYSASSSTGGLLVVGNSKPLVLYTGGSEKMRLDSSGNLGLGVTPSAWQVNNRAIQLLEGWASISANNSQGCCDVASNAYNAGSAASSGWRYTNSSTASTLYQQSSGQHRFFTAPSGTAGNAITFTQAMTLDASGNLGIGTTSPGAKLDVAGSARVWNGVDNGRLVMTGYYAGFTETLAQIAFYNNSSSLSDKNTSYIKGLVGSNNNTGVLAFWTADGSNATERMRIDSSGNVMVGQTSQTGNSKVSVTASASTAAISVAASSSGNTGYVFNTGNYGFIDYNSGAGTGYIRISALNDGGSYQNPILFGHNTNATYGSSTFTERMRIDSSGNVGINTTTPTTKLDVAGSSSLAALRTPNILEISTVSATAATGTINFDVTTQSVVYYTTNASGNFTLNFRGSSGTSLNTIMNTGDTVTVTFLCTNGSTAYYNSAVQVDGSSVTPKWLGGTAPTSGNASSVDAYTYAIIKTGSAAFTVLASQTKFA